MKKTHTLFISLLIFTITSVYAQNFYTAHHIGGLNAVAEGRAVGHFNYADQCIVGNFKGTVDFDSGPGTYTMASASNSSDIFLKRTTINNNLVYAKQIGGTGIDSVFSMVIIGANSIYITGTFEGVVDFDPGPASYTLASTSSQQDVFILHLDGGGNFVWAKKMDGAGIEKSTSLAVNPAGNILVTGYFNGIVDFDPSASTYTIASTNDDIFILNLNSSGNFIWAKSMGGSSVDRSNEIVTDPSNNIYTTGVISSVADLDPGVGSYTLASSGSNYSAFISKLDPNGNFVWAKQLGTGLSNVHGNAIALDGLGNVVTTGNFNGTADFDPGTGVFNTSSIGNSDMYISKLDAAGNFVWAKQFGSLSGNSALAIGIDNADDVFFSGSYTGTTDFDPDAGTYTLTASVASTDAFITKINANGNFIWTYSITGSGNEKCLSMTKNPISSLDITGSFDQNINFGPTSANYTAIGMSDAFVLRISSVIIIGVEEYANNKDLYAFPNPTANTLKLSGYTFSESSSVILYDLLGEKVIESRSEEINLGDLKNGIYFLQLFDKGKLIGTEKIIKE